MNGNKHIGETKSAKSAGRKAFETKGKIEVEQSSKDGEREK
jgi:hypothetical protein